MSKTDRQSTQEKIACEICLEEIPQSEVDSDEASDYVRHYFGLECYAIWKKQEESM